MKISAEPFVIDVGGVELDNVEIIESGDEFIFTFNGATSSMYSVSFCMGCGDRKQMSPLNLVTEFLKENEKTHIEQGDPMDPPVLYTMFKDFFDSKTKI